jgi:ABC-type branched-subunit amino acid transport system ATPase component
MTFFGTHRHQSEEEHGDRIARELLKLVSVSLLADQIVTSLPYSTQRRLNLPQLGTAKTNLGGTKRRVYARFF